MVKNIEVAVGISPVTAGSRHSVLSRNLVTILAAILSSEKLMLRDKYERDISLTNLSHTKSFSPHVGSCRIYVAKKPLPA
jgi:hypothetical protein